MGLSRPALRFLAREHARRPFAGPVLLLGRQGVYATLAEARAIVASEGLAPRALAPGEGERSNIPDWAGTPYEGFTSDAAFFALLGLPGAAALDVSSYEKADWIADLNLPVPSELHGRFSLILDAGTLEHVFDVRRCLMNIAAMLRPGGRVVHLSPMNNFVNHGFYQFSPTAFYDYYEANGFADLRGFVADEPRLFSHLGGWDVYELPARVLDQPSLLAGSGLLEVLFTAEKTEASTAERIPVQSFFRGAHASGGAAAGRATPRDKPVWRGRIPEGLKLFLRRWVLVSDSMNRLPVGLRRLILRLLPGGDPSRRPWGLRLWGRLA